MACFEDNFVGDIWAGMFGGPEKSCKNLCNDTFAKLDPRREDCRQWCKAQCPKTKKIPPRSYFDEKYSPENYLTLGEVDYLNTQTFIPELQGNNNSNTLLLWGVGAFVIFIVIAAGMFLILNE